MKKRILILCLAAAMVLALFSGCAKNPPAPATAAPDGQETQAPAATEKPAATAAPSSTEKPAETEKPDPQETEAPPEEPGLPFAVDDRGIATEQYNWPLPLTDSDKPISYWFTIWTPEYIGEGGFGETELPVEAQKRTGVHVEYVSVPSSSRKEAFSVALAADDLCDICCNANSYYPGTPVEMVEDGNFVNVFDYKEYMPNFMYYSTYDRPDDLDTHSRIFYFEDFVPAVYNMNIQPGEMIGGYVIRQDFMDRIGWDKDKLVTWDDWFDCLTALKVGIDTVDYPMFFNNTIEVVNYWQFHSFGSMTAIPTTALPSIYLKDGKVQLGCTTQEDLALITKLRTFFDAGLISPNWISYASATDYSDERHNDHIAIMYDGAVNLYDAENLCVNPDCNWQPVQKPLQTAGQILTVGKSGARTGTGCCSFASTCEDIPLAMKWIDYRYSPEGWELYCYGPEGVICYIDENGVRRNTDWAVNNPNGWSLSWLTFIYSLDAFCDPGLCATETKLLNPSGDKAVATIKYWTKWLAEHYDKSGLYPVGAKLTSEQSDEIAQYRNNVVTFIAENFSLFADGARPLSEWDSYVAELERIGLNEIRDIYQEAYQDYLKTLA